MNIFTVFFLFFYLILDSIKYSNNDMMSALKKKQKKLRYSVCIIKLVMLIIVVALVLLNRLLPSGKLERSVGNSSIIILIFVFGILIYLSILDIKKAGKERVDFFEKN